MKKYKYNIRDIDNPKNRPPHSKSWVVSAYFWYEKNIKWWWEYHFAGSTYISRDVCEVSYMRGIEQFIAHKTWGKKDFLSNFLKKFL